MPADRWRVVLIAGDNNSPAFDNGVEAMRAKLVGRGRARHPRLTSDPAANPSLPVATAANMSSALRSAGGEACLVFITSHGDESGFFLRPDRRGRPGRARPGARRRLRRAADRARGVGLPQRHLHHARTRRPNRIILAAAAADRSSFGCGAGDEYTYYDQCLLQQFDGASTWPSLAQTTRTCVENSSKMGVRRPSLPQTLRRRRASPTSGSRALVVYSKPSAATLSSRA